MKPKRWECWPKWPHEIPLTAQAITRPQTAGEAPPLKTPPTELTNREEVQACLEPSRLPVSVHGTGSYSEDNLPEVNSGLQGALVEQHNGCESNQEVSDCN